MTYNPATDRRRSIRLPFYDYSQNGFYFITICSYEKQYIFGHIINNKTILNNLGKIVVGKLLKTETIRNNVKIGEYAIMPNHLHVIIEIGKNLGVGVLQYGNNVIGKNLGGGVLQYAPTPDFDRINIFKSPSQSIGSIVRGFKSITTKRINILRRTPGMPVWHRNYYEHVVRDDDDYWRIVNYIKCNPAKWKFDRKLRK